MIKIIDINFNPLQNIFNLDSNDTFLCRIGSLYNTYGIDKSFVNFWLQLDDNSHITSVISMLDFQMTLYLTQNSNIEEIEEFIYIIGAKSVLTDYKYNLKLNSFNKLSGDILKFDYKFNMQTVSNQINTTPPKVKDLYKLLNSVYGNNFADQNSFCLDVSHKLLKRTSRIYSITDKGELVSCAMTVAEFQNTAIIGAVATLKSSRSNGLATDLVMRFADKLTQEGKSVYVYTDNSKINEFYNKIGFNKDGKWNEFVINGEN